MSQITLNEIFTSHDLLIFSRVFTNLFGENLPSWINGGFIIMVKHLTYEALHKSLDAKLDTFTVQIPIFDLVKTGVYSTTTGQKVHKLTNPTISEISDILKENKDALIKVVYKDASFIFRNVGFL